MNDTTERRVPWILWPFCEIWKLVTIILEIAGRALCALFGIALMATSVAMSLSIISSQLDVPLEAFGFLMTVRALF